MYRTTARTFQPLPNLSSHPADLAQTTTTQGKSVPYIVLVETGTINRGIYETAVLHDPTTETAPTPFKPPAAWNHRLVYTLVGGWYIQGASIGNGGILEDLMLRQGYGLAASTCHTVKAIAGEEGPISETVSPHCSGRQKNDGRGGRRRWKTS